MSSQRTDNRTLEPMSLRAIAIVVLLGMVLLGGFVAAALWRQRQSHAEQDSSPGQPSSNEAKDSSTAQTTANKAGPAEIPVIDFTDVDKAVVKAVQGAQTDVKLNPHSGAAWGKLGMVYFAHEFEDAAARAFAEAEKLQPKEPRWPYLHGLSLVRLQPDAAIPLIERGAELAGDAELAPRLRLFEAYLQVDQLDKAAGHLEQFLSKHPNNARARVAMARVKLRQGKLEECLAQLEKAEADRAAIKSVHELRAEVYQRQGNQEGATAERKLASSTPAFRWPDPFQREASELQQGLKKLLNRAEQLYQAGRDDESIALLDYTVQEYPESEWAWNFMARAQVRQRRLPQAEAALNKALAINPESADAQFRMGVVQQLRGLPSKSIEWFEKVIEVKPDHPVAHYNLGRAYQRRQEIDTAIDHLEKAIEYAPDYFDPHVTLAEVLASQGKNDEAKKLFRRALELKPDSDYAKAKLASIEQNEAAPDAAN